MRNQILFIFLFFILLISACVKTQQTSQQTIQKPISTVSAAILNPEQVVILYFQSWNDKKYDVMYSLISDGFKQIEPTATTFNDFKSYMAKFYDTSSGINVIETKEAYRNDKEAGVNY